MHTTPPAMYARVSSEQHAATHTIASQVAALQERVVTDGLALPEMMPFLDEGSRGGTLVRPALERWRDLVAAGAVDRLSVHSPDRLARQYASQVLRGEACQRMGVEIIFVNREVGRSPEDEVLLHVQGMMAEYARAKIVERPRRGTLPAARAGAVPVLSGAPYGYRYVPKDEGGGQARSDVVPDEARVVRQMCAWMGDDRLSIGDICRRRTHAGEVTRTGKTVWDRRVIWGMLKHPASMGAAALGKTHQGPLQPRRRAQRGRPLRPRRAVSTHEVPPEDWMTIAVPALVEGEVFRAVQAQLQDNRPPARQSRRGARALLQGVVQCPHWGSALYGKPVSRKAAKGTRKTSASSRCLGTDAYRFGGERVCDNTPVRTEVLDLAVWREVWSLLAHPERLAEAYRRRLQAPARGKRQEHPPIEAQRGTRRQGLARLLDSDAEGLIETQAFAPRLTRLRQRIAPLEAQHQRLADEATLSTALRLIIGRLEDFATKVHGGLEDANWLSKWELIRALVKRVDVAHEQVHVVFRVEHVPIAPSAEKKSLQDCRGSELSTTRKYLSP